MPTATEAKLFSNIAATTAAFALLGGRYVVTVSATFGGGSVKFQILGPDNATFISIGADFTAAGVATVDVPPGQFRLTIATATAVFASICRVPN
jgi:hypothetical protein